MLCTLSALLSFCTNFRNVDTCMTHLTNRGDSRNEAPWSLSCFWDVGKTVSDAEGWDEEGKRELDTFKSSAAQGSGHPGSPWCGWAWEGSTQSACRVAQKNENSPSVSITHVAAKQQCAQLFWLDPGKVWGGCKERELWIWAEKARLTVLLFARLSFKPTVWKTIKSLVNRGYTTVGNHSYAHRVLLAAQHTLGMLCGCCRSSLCTVPVHCRYCCGPGASWL